MTRSEAVGAEERVPHLRQLVQAPHAEERREDREQNRALVRDRDVRRDRPGRLTGDVPGPSVRVAVPLQEHAADGAGEAAAEDDQRKDRPLDAHRRVDAVHRERAVAVELGVAGVADLAGSFNELARGVELGEDAVISFSSRRRGRSGCRETSTLVVPSLRAVAASVGLRRCALDLAHRDDRHEAEEQRGTT